MKSLAKLMHNLCLKLYTFFDSNTSRNLIYSYLLKYFNVSPLQACAILGNIAVESWKTYSSLILQGSNKRNLSYVINYKIKDGKGWGILQWTYYTRKQGLLNYTNRRNSTLHCNIYNVGDLIIQLEYFNWERQNTCKNGWNAFKKAKGLNQMVRIFCEKYECAGIPHLAERIAAAKECAKIFGVKY